ncbi:MAG: sodium:solute symporter [Acidobacteria bacterium RIFCSPLOWO2_12_FULL_67_14b]|nr:MAG: sodium:solute symporter [Acidobacteria bacterium RIFCSPLOWO2_12_FULL_67_14b]
MSAVDWAIIVVYLAWIVWDGIRLSKNTGQLEGYFLASRSLPWWAVGLSVMATQLSAITMIGTTGQGYAVGMSLLQQYYALPIAMIIIAVTFVPFFHNARIFTAYEYLEKRFDAKTRALTAFLFLLQRGMSCGAVIAAPAVVLSVMVGVDVATTCLLIALPTAAYTMFGGVQAVAWTDVKQMYLIVGGLVATCIALMLGLPDNVSVGEALHIAGTTGRLQVFDFSTDPRARYTFWTGTLGALFLFLSYFGTDQSQVQRYLTAKSIDQARSSLFMSAYWKIPLQALVMIIGVFMFIFYVFTPPPMLFNPVHDQRVRESANAGEYVALEQKFGEALAARKLAAERLAEAQRSEDPGAKSARAAAFDAEEQRVLGVRAEAVALVKAVSGDATYNDINYVFPTFVLTHLPVGLIGLLMAAIFAAAMSTISGELSALSTSTSLDFYRRWVRDDGDEAHLLRVTKAATVFWSVFAAVTAIWAAELGSLIEVVNRFGSFFYGSILGVFLLAIGWKRANGTGASVGLVAGMGVVAYVTIYTPIAFLWHNLIGAGVVFVVGMIVSEITPRAEGTTKAEGRPKAEGRRQKAES